MTRRNANATGAPTVNHPAGIKDIAKALGVSIGTVDRALHGRPGINPLTRTRVLKMAQTLGYRPNVAARYLKLKRRLRISVHLPREIASFFDALREGIRQAAESFQSTVDLEFRMQPRLGEGDIELFQQALEDESNGIIIAPGRPKDLKPWIRKAARARIPVVCVATDAPKTERLTAVSADPFISGALAAELLSLSVQKPGKALLVTGDLSTFDHAEKLRGFQRFLAKRTGLELGPVIQAHDDPEEAYRNAANCLTRASDLRAIYVSTANSLPVIRAVTEANPRPAPHIITTDFFPELVPLIRKGAILGTIYQRPQRQGRMAFQALYQFIVEGKRPPARMWFAPHVIMRSNLDFFLGIQPNSFGPAARTVETPAL